MFRDAAVPTSNPFPQVDDLEACPFLKEHLPTLDT